MGIHDLLPHLPGGDMSDIRYSFFKEEALANQHVVPIDAAGALWQFAYAHAPDYLRGNYSPSLSEWAKLLNYLRSIVQWKLKIFMDGRSNPFKSHENERCQQRAETSDDERSQIRTQSNMQHSRIHCNGRQGLPVHADRCSRVCL